MSDRSGADISAQKLQSDMKSNDRRSDRILAPDGIVLEGLHGLSADNWSPGGCYDVAVAIRAAWNPNPNVLRTILKYGDPYYPQGQDDTSYYLRGEIVE